MHPVFVLATVIHLSLGIVAQTPLYQKIWSTVIYTLHGESTPYAYLEDQTLTPLGAHQLFRAGASLRSRYVNPRSSSSSSSYLIDGISRRKLVPDQVDVVSVPDQFISASAQAFMQGIYPPVGPPTNFSYPDESANRMADGTIMNFPLNGYQYPQIYTPNTKDPNYIWISGHTNCPMYTSSVEVYLSSEEYQKIDSETSSFYARLYTSLLDGFFSSYRSAYSNALPIFEYLNYIYNHNQWNRPTLSDVNHARSLADKLAFSMNGDFTAQGDNSNDRVRAVAGRTLARSVLSGLERNIMTYGEMAKMTLLFGSFEPMVAFYSLVRLASETRPDFYRIPEFGSSLIFELYTLESSVSASYPSSRSDLMVRFLVRNGTDISSPPTPYPLFGHGPGVIGLSYYEFEAEMESLMVRSTKEWCSVCNSSNVFCPFYDTQTRDPFSEILCAASNRLNPAVAGVIGAGVTAALIAILGAVVTYILIRRTTKRSAMHRPTAGVFRGRTKLSSDPTLAEGGSSDTTVNGDRDVSVGTTGASDIGASINHPEGTGNSFEMMPRAFEPLFPLRRNGQEMGRTRRRQHPEADDESQMISYPQPTVVREQV